MTLPERTQAQRMDALATANHRRITRAAWKKEVKAGSADVRDVLADPPAGFESMKVLEVLRAAPKVGKVKADRLARVAMVSPSKTLGGLSARQRSALIALLPRG